VAAYADGADVAGVWRTLTTAETYSASVLLDRVSALMRQSSPGLDARIAENPDLALIASGIAVDAVLRVLDNPRGVVAETVGPWSFRRSDAVADGRLYLTAGELAQLNSGDAAPRGAFTIRPGPNPAGAGYVAWPIW